MKKYIILLAIILILPSIFAINLNVEKQSSDEVMILGLNDSAVFSLDITNNGSSDSFNIYTFFGSGFSPKENFDIASGETKNIQFSVSPPYYISRTGFTLFSYFIRASDSSEYSEKLLVKVIDLADAFEIGSGELYPEDNSLDIYIKNKVNFNFNDLSVHFSSPFFEDDESFSLSPNEKKTFKITLNKDDFNKLTAGFYTLNAEIIASGKKAEVTGTINFVEKKDISETIDKYGLIIRTKVITKSNNGNTPEIVNIELNKNIISRLFSSFSPEPTSVVRNNSKINYVWNKELKPGEELEVKVRTNWFLPLLFIVLIVATVVFVKEYTNTTLKIRKKISFVKSKGGEFALKVSLILTSREQLENVLIIDRIPLLVKLYKKFGREKPAKIDENAKKIEWQFPKLEAGERRIIHYLVYSKVGVIGRFALPRAVGIYEKKGKIEETSSNKVFFLNEKAAE